MTRTSDDTIGKTNEKWEHAGIEEYGIKIEKIKEIIGMMTIKSVPQTDEHMTGVINLRGRVIPAI